jgi:tetratricopeptide (TPR) repeat protein
MPQRFAIVAGVAVMVALGTRAATAQPDAFVAAVRELALASGRPEPARSNDRRAATERIAAALAEWDRRIATVEDHAKRESTGGSADFGLRVQLGATYYTRGRIADAMREFDAAAALRPSSSDVQVLRALTLEAAGRPEDARRAFRDAWSLDANDPVKAYYMLSRAGSAATPAERDRARGSLTNAYSRLRSSDTARALTPPFVTLDGMPDTLSRTPVVADDATSQAFGLFRTHQFGDAVAALRADRGDRSSASDSPLTHFVRAQQEEAQGRVAEARRDYGVALEGTLAGRSVLLVAIARLAQVDGDLPGAIDAFAEAVRLNPNETIIRKEFASTYAAAGRTDDAFGELIAALLIDPGDGQTHAAVGQLYLDTGRHADAVAAFRRALALAPTRFEVRYALATALTRAGDTAEAAKEFEIYERQRRDALERRRRDISDESEREDRSRSR